MSLHTILNNLIKEKGYLPYEEVVRIALGEGYKPSNAERRLRKSESPEVEPVMGTSKRGTEYIKGYAYKPKIIIRPSDYVAPQRETIKMF